MWGVQSFLCEGLLVCHSQPRLVDRDLSHVQQWSTVSKPMNNASSQCCSDNPGDASEQCGNDFPLFLQINNCLHSFGKTNSPQRLCSCCLTSWASVLTYTHRFCKLQIAVIPTQQLQAWFSNQSKLKTNIQFQTGRYCADLEAMAGKINVK